MNSDLYDSKAVTCLALSADGFLLVSGSEDGLIRVWDTRTRNIVRVFRHTKGTFSDACSSMDYFVICLTF